MQKRHAEGMKINKYRKKKAMQKNAGEIKKQKTTKKAGNKKEVESHRVPPAFIYQVMLRILIDSPKTHRGQRFSATNHTRTTHSRSAAHTTSRSLLLIRITEEINQADRVRDTRSDRQI